MAQNNKWDLLIYATDSLRTSVKKSSNYLSDKTSEFIALTYITYY